jgi:hypothetical protein
MGRVDSTLPQYYDSTDYGTEELDLTSHATEHANRTLQPHFINNTLPDQMLPTEENSLSTLQTARLPEDRLPDANNALGTSQGKDAMYQELVRRLTDSFPMMKKDEARGVDANVKDSLLETLCDNTPIDPTMFIQAPAVKTYDTQGNIGQEPWMN